MTTSSKFIERYTDDYQENWKKKHVERMQRNRLPKLEKHRNIYSWM